MQQFFSAPRHPPSRCRAESCRRPLPGAANRGSQAVTAVPGLSACSSCRSGPQAKGRAAHPLSCSSHLQGHRSKVTHTNDCFQYPPFRSEALYQIKPNLRSHLPAQKSTRCRDGRSQIPTDSSTGKLCGQAPRVTATLPAAGSPTLL